MPDAYVIMTALPPTTGHLELIQFAARVTDGKVHVLINTQPHEPFSQERYEALRDAVNRCGLDQVQVHHIHRTLDQDPASPGFWDMWKGIYLGLGIQPGDYLVASETYGQKLAQLTDARFMPYDINRTMNQAKATFVRADPLAHFDKIVPEFRPHLQTRITIIGAESTGKSTLSRELADAFGVAEVEEWARPYLENTVNEITIQTMTEIWKGQRAIQCQAREVLGQPVVIQDTDLFATVGYWRLPHWQNRLGPAPDGLVHDAIDLRSDLYIFTPANIPYEFDPLRYGNGVREGDDRYWLNVCEEFDLPYVVLEASDRADRFSEAYNVAKAAVQKKLAKIAYDRGGL